MNGKYLVINAGSSSLKFSLYEVGENINEATEIVNGYIEKLGKEDSFFTLKIGDKKIEKKEFIKDHSAAVDVMLGELLTYNFINSVDEIKGIGHRVLHGGEKYSESVVIDDKVLDDIISLTKLGPIHHPGQIAGIKSMQEKFPNALQVAVFDTAFHQTIPKEKFLYSIPIEWYNKYGVRKYGFHGTSHKYITEKMQEFFAKEDVNLITCHIGSGASITCIKDGLSYDTTMGLTPTDGLMMGTRSGSIDPTILQYVCKESGLSVEQATEKLNSESGLFGICGKSDLRDVEKLANEGNEKAKLALEMYVSSIANYIVQYYNDLKGDVDAIVFTAGVGENDMNIRRRVIEKISNITGIILDNNANENIAKFKDQHSGIITTRASKIPVFVVPTNEEYMILKDCYKLTKSLNKNSNVYVKKLNR